MGGAGQAASGVAGSLGSIAEDAGSALGAAGGSAHAAGGVGHPGRGNLLAQAGRGAGGGMTTGYAAGRGGEHIRAGA